MTCGRAWAFVEITVSRTCINQPLLSSLFFLVPWGLLPRFDCIHVLTEMCVECVNHYKQPLKYMGDWYNFFKSVMQLITVLLWVGCILKCSITWRLNFITRANEWSFFVANHKDIIYLVWRHKVTIFIIQGEDWKMYLLLVQKVTKPLFLFLAGFFAMMWTKRKGNTVLLLFQVQNAMLNLFFNESF